jgi:hypothetical protein
MFCQINYSHGDLDQFQQEYAALWKAIQSTLIVG